MANSTTLQAGWVSHLVQRFGPAAIGGAQVLHPRQRAQHLALHASRRPADRRDDGGGARCDDQLFGRDQERRPRRPRRRSRGMGLERLLLQRLRPAVRIAARLELPARPREPRQHGLSAVAAAAVEDQIRSRPAPCDRRVHRSLLPAGRRVRQRHQRGDAVAPQPFDAVAVGSELHRRDLDQRQGAAHSAACATG